MTDTQVATTVEAGVEAGAREAPARRGWLDLFSVFPRLKAFVQTRSFQFLLILPNLAIFYFFIITGIFGNPMGNQNITIIFIWILWWFLLIAFLVPLTSRLWCTMCPLPAAGEWLQRRAIVDYNPDKPLGRDRWWPKRFKNIWLQNIGFLLLALFSVLLVTRPLVTVIVVGGIGVLSTILMLIYKRRAFCVYLCPVSGFQGLYAMFAPIALRSKDKDVCANHRGKKGCMFGAKPGDEQSYGGYACPWFEYIGTMDRNNYCGLCMECMKTCQKDNIGLFLRPFASDIRIKGYDEAWKAFIMTVLAMVYSITLLGPYGLVKDWANVTWSGQVGGFLIYATSVAAACLLIFPGIHLAFAYASTLLSGNRDLPVKKVFVAYAYLLVPFGLLAWIAFSLPLLMVNGSYIVQVLSDPFGWGWDLLGTAHVPWTPVLPETVPYLQALILLIGLVLSTRKGYDVARELFQDRNQALRSLVPMAAYMVMLTIGFLVFFTA
jgi:hypothetical protein